ncbi:hypothetical protein KIN20_016734 [Parelaphostrongylus tenuis]|uniref:Uncharacterized protein n=1 Tax=Parelaphostrongylus tenuis TaxID=148309 RepID=A0AAD5N018_PARTN|nr:hypothetical protein KIN20_016734 [Parelaphostrongylus tenuis]
MLVVDTSTNPNHLLCRRRTRSEPCRKRKSLQFARFESLRGAKAVRRDWRRPIRVDVVSIPSSAESDRRQRKPKREQARRRWEVQLSPSSSSSSTSTSLYMASKAPPPLVVERHFSCSTSDASSEQSTSTELAIAAESTNESNFALLISGMSYGQRKGYENLPALNLEDSSVAQRKIPSTVLDRLHLELVHLPDNSTKDYFRNVSYSTDMENFARENHLNSFMDPFEEERRLSRTEVWVESTSPGFPSDHEEADATCAVSLDECLGTRETKILELPEKSISSSPPCNTTTSTTGIDEDSSPAPQAHNNDDLPPDMKVPKIELSQMDSTTTSEKSETNSYVSSDLDKTSIVKMKFNCNLHRAREDAKKEVDMNAFDRFWRYHYKKNDSTDNTTFTGSNESKRKNGGRNRHRGHSPTIDRVVMYYTTDRRPSSTPSLLFPLYSSEPPTQRSDQSEAGAHLFVQSAKHMMVVRQDPSTSKPTGNNVKLHVKPSSPRISEISSNSDELIGSGQFFRLSEISGSDSDHGGIVIESNEGGPAGVHQPTTSSQATGISLKDKSTSTADLNPPFLDINYSEGRGLENTYKRMVRDKSTSTSPSLDHIEFHWKKAMQDQSTSMPSSSLSQSSVPAVVLDDAPETDVSLPDFRDQLSDLETSSTEDLLAIDTRPSSCNRKSVTFLDTIDAEIIPQDYPLRSPSPDPQNITVKPILKKEDKRRESMRRLLDYVAERLYKDLLMLVEERDRSIHALELTSTDQEANMLSVHSTIFQQKYRGKLLENKFTLDQKIEQVWSKLKDMAVDGAAGQFVNGVRHSSELTLNVKRRLHGRRESVPVTTQKPRNEFEMACDFSRRLSLMRSQMVRRDSESFEDNRSMEELMGAISRMMSG